VKWAVVTTLALSLLATPVAKADHKGKPCGNGGNRKENKRMTRCLTKQFGLKVDTTKALRIANCESGFYAKAGAGSTYQGIYQLGRLEFKAFKHQGPRWVDQEFRDHNYRILSARGNVLAALAHAHRYGWGAWSCQ